MLERLPGGRVIALDGSVQMLERARDRLTDNLGKVTFVRADLRYPLPISDPVDAIFSVAAFHWVPDHQALFGRLFSVLKHGGRIAADCGGKGNIVNVSSAIAEVMGERIESGLWNFASAEETSGNLQAAGFVDVDVSLQGDPAYLEPGEELESYLTTVILGAHLKRLAPSERPEFVAAVAQRLPEGRIDYQRLTIQARRP